MTAVEMAASRTIWEMGSLPFHVGPLPRFRVVGFPQRMLFRVGYDDTLGLFTQVYDQRVADALHAVYARGSQLGIPMGDHGLGKAYADDFEEIIRGWLGGDLVSRDVLEIGCGSGHLLGALADAGARAFGVEPDPRCAEALRERDIPVATCELEEFEPGRAFDAVVHYCVWEHARDPVDFLVRQKALLQPGGCVICAVPDCTEGLAMGDISIFIHQHWSYFTVASLRRVAAAAGLRVQRVQAARVGGVLYASLIDAATDAAPAAALADARQIEPEDLVERCRRSVARVVGYVRDTQARGRSQGIYCPARAINYVPEDDAVVASPRLFDDSPLLRDKFMPPFTKPVEGGAGLESRSVDEVLIMSRSFGGQIEASIRNRRPKPAPVIRHIDDVLAGD